MNDANFPPPTAGTAVPPRETPTTTKWGVGLMIAGVLVPFTFLIGSIMLWIDWRQAVKTGVPNGSAKVGGIIAIVVYLAAIAIGLYLAGTGAGS